MERILVLNPPRVGGLPVVREERFEHKDMGTVYPPLNLLYVTAVLEREFGPETVEIIDANGWDIGVSELLSKVEEIAPKLVISRLAFDTQNEDLAVLSKIKERTGAVIAIRNKIIADVPRLREDTVRRSAVDIFINTEPEAVVSALARALFEGGKLDDVPGIVFVRDGEPITTPLPPPIEDLDSLPFPAYHRLPDLSPYHTGLLEPVFATVTTSRGCPYACTFCAYGLSTYRVRSPENVVAELKWLKDKFGLQNFLFFDDMISQLPGRIERICELMLEEKLGLKWACCTRANKIDFDALVIMKRAGCVELAVGIESGSPDILKRIKKGVTRDDIRLTALNCRLAGIHFYAMTIIGLPGETERTVQETIEFIKEIKPFYTQFCFCVPFPNTKIYKYYEENSLLMTSDWSRFSPLSLEPVVRTAKLDAGDLVRLRKMAYNQTQFFNLSYLFSQVSFTDWRWNLRGLKKLIERIVSMLRGGAVR